eukprot:TRINITY_DN4969_c0_g1_i1.p1 TRINITY_DN4969_c0_g1~~TRINITY_DN4969_c0_g1_i1.p1  ORF type:complete len:182 (+),score=94.85 TRINITY_DN4969_c0_g1_i1:798-1343(+)
MRVYDSETNTCQREFLDVIDRMQWKQGCFSANAEYVIGGSVEDEHKIYIWNRSSGQLEKLLEGPKEGIMDLVWHPLKPIIVSCSTSGVVYVWGTNYCENWSAFAPDFKELEANEEYYEREDEFDIIEDDEIENKVNNTNMEGDDEEIDILTIEKNAALSSDVEDELFFIPPQVNIITPEKM